MRDASKSFGWKPDALAWGGSPLLSFLLEKFPEDIIFSVVILVALLCIKMRFVYRIALFYLSIVPDVSRLR